MSGAESTGVNLLHWATITNRTAVISSPAAGVLSTPWTDSASRWMYAATLDQERPALRRC